MDAYHAMSPPEIVSYFDVEVASFGTLRVSLQPDWQKILPYVMMLAQEPSLTVKAAAHLMALAGPDPAIRATARAELTKLLVQSGLDVTPGEWNARVTAINRVGEPIDAGEDRRNPAPHGALDVALRRLGDKLVERGLLSR